MTDKVQKIKEWISKTQDGLMDTQGNFEYLEHEGAYHILCNLDAYIDSLQKESNTKEYLCIKNFYPYKKGKVYKSIDGGFPANAKEYFKFVEEPTTSVWHDASEKAINNAPILFHSTYDNRWYALSHNRINWNVVDKWTYIDDLLKL